MSDLHPYAADGAFIALGGLLTGVVNWLLNRRKANAEADATLAEAWPKLFAEMRAEMAARDARCEEQIDIKVQQVRNDFDEMTLKLRSIIYSLAKKMPLDAKQREMLAQIAPDSEHGGPPASDLPPPIE